MNKMKTAAKLLDRIMSVLYWIALISTAFILLCTVFFALVSGIPDLLRQSSVPVRLPVDLHAPLLPYSSDYPGRVKALHQRRTLPRNCGKKSETTCNSVNRSHTPGMAEPADPLPDRHGGV